MKATRSKVLLSIIAAAIFAIAMAYLESAVVVYLRRIYGITDLSRALISFDQLILIIEGGRELATLIMLCLVAILAGRNIQSRLGYFLLLFGFWDIFYYFWLRVFIGWPIGWFDTDLLFMLPMPWWGPVLAPIFIALLMATAGIALVWFDGKEYVIRPGLWGWAFLIAGVLIDLYVFMSDAIAALPAPKSGLSSVQMGQFNWLVFFVGYVLILFSMACTLKKSREGSRH